MPYFFRSCKITHIQQHSERMRYLTIRIHWQTYNSYQVSRPLRQTIVLVPQPWHHRTLLREANFFTGPQCISTSHFLGCTSLCNEFNLLACWHRIRPSSAFQISFKPNNNCLTICMRDAQTLLFAESVGILSKSSISRLKMPACDCLGRHAFTSLLYCIKSLCEDFAQIRFWIKACFHISN